jgi:multiple sugar transport system substrate-binding protein
MNTVAIEQFRAQLPTYLTSANPADVLTWYAGSVARDYASKGLLLDLSDMWTGDGACAKFSPALRTLSSDDSGKQIFVPTNYYWWSVFTGSPPSRSGESSRPPAGTGSWRCWTR